jgi:Peptidase inhibitor family I36
MASPNPARFLVIFIAAACLTLGCDKAFPPAGPLDDLVPTGINIYQHADYTGVSAHVTADVSDLSSYSGGCKEVCSYDQFGSSCTSYWGDCVSSIKVATGWKATVYVKSDFGGDSEELTADVPNLGQIAGPCKGNWNDCISSIRVGRR